MKTPSARTEPRPSFPRGEAAGQGLDTTPARSDLRLLGGRPLRNRESFLGSELQMLLSGREATAVHAAGGFPGASRQPGPPCVLHASAGEPPGRCGRGGASVLGTFCK